VRARPVSTGSCARSERCGTPEAGRCARRRGWGRLRPRLPAVWARGSDRRGPVASEPIYERIKKGRLCTGARRKIRAIAELRVPQARLPLLNSMNGGDAFYNTAGCCEPLTEETRARSRLIRPAIPVPRTAPARPLGSRLMTPPGQNPHLGCRHHSSRIS
jgi:hypothetical protein